MISVSWLDVEFEFSPKFCTNIENSKYYKKKKFDNKSVKTEKETKSNS